LTQTSAIPAQSNITTESLTTSTSTPAIAGDESLMQTHAVTAESNIPAAPPPESSGIGRKGVLALMAFLAVVGGLTVFLLRREGKADHASLITRAMGEHKDEHKDDDKHEDKPEEKKGDTTVTRKFPPPMT